MLSVIRNHLSSAAIFLSFVSRLSIEATFEKIRYQQVACLQAQIPETGATKDRQVELILCDRKKLKSPLTKTIKKIIFCLTCHAYGAVICNRPLSIKFSLIARPRGHKQKKWINMVIQFSLFVSSKPRCQAAYDCSYAIWHSSHRIYIPLSIVAAQNLNDHYEF